MNSCCIVDDGKRGEFISLWIVRGSFELIAATSHLYCYASMLKAATAPQSANTSQDLKQSSILKSDVIDTTVDTESPSISPPPSSAASPATECSSPSPQGVKPSSRHVQVAIKILVTNNASGSIIGRGGKTITDLQNQSQARIKLSQGGDYYPGTSDRVCLIHGALSNVEVAVEMVVAKLYDIHRLQHIDAPATRSGAVYSQSGTDNIPTDVPFTVRILLPASSCGMIIGHGGSNIKQLKEKSNVSYVQLSPKATEVLIGASALSTSERIMTILGPTFESCVSCIQVILNELAQHPEICRYMNMTTSYSKALLSAFQASYNTYQMPTLIPGLMLDQYGMVDRDQRVGFQQYDGILPSSPPTTSQTMMQPASPPPSSPLMLPQSQFWSDASSGGTPGSSSGMHSITELAGSFQERLSMSDTTPRVLPPFLPTSEISRQMDAPDSMVGFILGRGGKVLNRIQSRTQTLIRLSQRGEFRPGTTNRIVTITGTTSESVEHAMDLINERLSSAESIIH